MGYSTHFIRSVRTLALLCALAGATASVAAASGGRPPDVSDAAAAVSAPVPDVFERYAAAHPYGGTVAVARPPDVADVASTVTAVPDVFERAVQRAQATQALRPDDRPGIRGVGASEPVTSALRPDDRPGPLGIGQPQFVALSSGNGFHWGDWGIGLAAGFGIALALAGALLLLTHRLPGRIGAAATR